MKNKSNRKSRLIVFITLIVGVVALGWFLLRSPPPLVEGDLSSEDVASIKYILRSQWRHESAQEISSNGVTALPRAWKKLTRRISDVKAVHWAAMWEPAAPAGNELILAEAEARVPIQIGTNHGHDIFILQKTKDGWSQLRIAGMHGQLKIPPEPEKALPVLIDYAHDPLPWVRAGAAEAMSRLFGAESRSAVPTLLELRNDPDKNVRTWATNALEDIGWKTADKDGGK